MTLFPSQAEYVLLVLHIHLTNLSVKARLSTVSLYLLGRIDLAVLLETLEECQIQLRSLYRLPEMIL